MPFLSGYSKRKAIEYGSVFPSSNLTDFPLLVVISGDSDIATELSGGGGIAVTSDDETTEIPFGLYPSSDPTSGDLILRLKTDVLTGASTGDVIAYIYFDSAETTVEDKAGVVSNGYEFFAPLEEDPSGSAPQIFDWVTESNVGISEGSMTGGDLISAVVGNGLDFDGSDDDIELGMAVYQYQVQTYSGWIKPTASNGDGRLIDNGSRAGFGIGSAGGTVPAGELGAEWFDNSNFQGLSSGVSPTTDVWYRLDWVTDSAGHYLYLDGVLVDSDSLTDDIGYTSRVVRIGCNWVGTGRLIGTADELSISSVARSADWIEYAHANDLTPEDTTQLGSLEEDGGGGGDTTISLSALVSNGVVVAPTVLIGNTVTPSPITANGVIVAPTVATGTSILPSPFSANGTLVTPSVVTGTEVTPSPLVTSGTLVAVVAGSGTGILLSPESARGVLVAPAISTGTTLVPSPLSGEGEVTSQTVAVVQAVNLSPLEADGVVTTQSVLVGTGIALGVLTARGVIAALTVSGGVVTVPPVETVTLDFLFRDTVVLDFVNVPVSYETLTLDFT